MSVTEKLSLEAALSPTEFVDSDHPAVIAFAQENKGESADPIDQAVSLYFAVRDGIRYNPYALDLSKQWFKASTALETGTGQCVSKSNLLAAACRAIGIPARLGYADVRNHLSTERMRQKMKTDVFFYHGYTAIYLQGKWVKATPAFNIELCEKFQLVPLDFNGREDSLFHPFDQKGQQHMEYLNERGEFDDFPYDDFCKTFRKEYGSTFQKLDPTLFDADVDHEVMTDTKA